MKIANVGMVNQNIISANNHNNSEFRYCNSNIKDTLSFKMAKSVQKKKSILDLIKKMLFGAGASAVTINSIKQEQPIKNETKTEKIFVPFKDNEIIKQPMTEYELSRRSYMENDHNDTSYKNCDFNQSFKFLYDKENLSKLKNDDLLRFIRENGFCVMNSDTQIFGSTDQNPFKEFVMPFENETKITLDNKEIVVPERHCILFNPQNYDWKLMPIENIFENKKLLKGNNDSADSFISNYNLRYTDKNNNIIEYYHTDNLFNLPNCKRVYNDKHQLLEVVDIGNNRGTPKHKTFEYDNAGRLVKQTYKADYNTTYTFDYNYDDENNRLFDVTINKYGFDVVGNNNGYKKDNLTIRKIDKKTGETECAFLYQRDLEEIYKMYKQALGKNPELANCDITADIYNLRGRKIFVTIKNENGEIVQKEGF